MNAEDASAAAAGAAATVRPPPILRVRGLTKVFGDRYALKDLSFDVPEGEIFGFIGPNGAGKTTTLRILSTLLEPTAGEVTIDGYSIELDTEWIRRIVGFMPEQFGVYEGVTVEEYLDFFGRAYRLSSTRREAVVRDVLELTDLGGVRMRMVSTLSRGMKQRLCLAKTLVHDPKVLLLDEPASALDPRARIELRALLKELGRMGKTIVISSHILTELSDLCTSVGIIEKGELVELSDMERVRKDGASTTKVTVRLHEPRSETEGVLEGQANVRELRVDGTLVTFEYLGAPEEFYEVLKRLVDNHIPVLSVQQQERSLEHLFLQVTKGDVQ
jgi:ABC-2 type transport system ATP-binding protein